MGRQQRFTVDLYLPCPAKGQGRLLAVCLNHPHKVNKLLHHRQASLSPVGPATPGSTPFSGTMIITVKCQAVLCR